MVEGGREPGHKVPPLFIIGVSPGVRERRFGHRCRVGDERRVVFCRGAEKLGDWRQWEVAQGWGGRRAAAQAREGLRTAAIVDLAAFRLGRAWPKSRGRAGNGSKSRWRLGRHRAG
jgi:hypothetical protein